MGIKQRGWGRREKYDTVRPETAKLLRRVSRKFMVLRGQKPGAGEVERANPRSKLTVTSCRGCLLSLATTGLFWLLIGQEEEGQAQG